MDLWQWIFGWTGIITQISEAERLVAKWEPNPARCEREAVLPGA